MFYHAESWRRRERKILRKELNVDYGGKNKMESVILAPTFKIYVKTYLNCFQL